MLFLGLLLVLRGKTLRCMGLGFWITTWRKGLAIQEHLLWISSEQEIHIYHGNTVKCGQRKVTCYCSSLNLFFRNPHPRIFFTGFRKRRREKREKRWSVASYMHPNWGSNPQPRYVPWPGIKPTTFWCIGRCSNQLSYQAKAAAHHILTNTTQTSYMASPKVMWKQEY